MKKEKNGDVTRSNSATIVFEKVPFSVIMLIEYV